MPPHCPPLTDAERRRRCDALRNRGGIHVGGSLEKDQLETLRGWIDTREADAVQDDERLRGRLYRKACWEAICRVLDTMSKSPSRVRLNSPEQD